jgi:hypothetical protein
VAQNSNPGDRAAVEKSMRAAMPAEARCQRNGDDSNCNILYNSGENMMIHWVSRGYVEIFFAVIVAQPSAVKEILILSINRFLGEFGFLPNQVVSCLNANQNGITISNQNLYLKCWDNHSDLTVPRMKAVRMEVEKINSF